MSVGKHLHRRFRDLPHAVGGQRHILHLGKIPDRGRHRDQREFLDVRRAHTPSPVFNTVERATWLATVRIVSRGIRTPATALIAARAIARRSASCAQSAFRVSVRSQRAGYSVTTLSPAQKT
jgi:hypothetical protein